MAHTGDIDWAAELDRAMREGLTVSELGRQLGVTGTTIRKFEFRCGIRLRRVRPDPERYSKPELDWPSVLRQAVEEGLNGSQLAVKLNMTLGAVLKAEERTGIRLRREISRRRRGEPHPTQTEGPSQD